MKTPKSKHKTSSFRELQQEPFPFFDADEMSFEESTPTPKVVQKKVTNGKSNGARLGFEETLWAAADKLRGHMDAAEYKHVVLGLIFLKYLSDMFYERYSELTEKGRDPEKPSEYTCVNLFWLAPQERWGYLKKRATDVGIGRLIDQAMKDIEEKNPSLHGVLPKDFARSSLNERRLGELIELISTVGLGDNSSRSQDILGRVYEYFLGRFANVEAKGGEFYTPQSVVKLLVEMIEPYKGKVYDPCCGSGGMFVQSEKFVQAHGGRIQDLSIYGQESNPTTWRLCKMNLAIRGISGDIGEKNADTFHEDLHPDLKADYIIANPPFNLSDWGVESLREDIRWKYGIPPKNNANFAWIQHKVYHLAPQGLAGFVLSNGALSTSQGREEGFIRAEIIDADLVDCIVALPSNLFYTTQIATSLWFLAKDKNDERFRDRRGQTLFIYAYNLGHLADRIHKELTNEEIEYIASTYHAWRSKYSTYKDIPGFCKSATLEDIRSHKYALVPGRYVGFDKHLKEHWDLSHLREEFLQVESRIAQIDKASKAALAVLKELLNG